MGLNMTALERLMRSFGMTGGVPVNYGSQLTVDTRQFVEQKIEGVDKKTRTVTGWASKQELDRYNEVVLADSFAEDLPTFQTNSPLLWGHDQSMPAIGSVSKVEVVSGEGLRHTSQFAKTDFADQVFQLYDEGHLKAWSVSFLPRKFRTPSDEDKSMFGDATEKVYTRSELLELSAVNVPASPGSLVGKSMISTHKDLQEFMTFIKAIQGKSGQLPVGKQLEEQMAEIIAAWDEHNTSHERVSLAIQAMATEIGGEEDTDDGDADTDTDTDTETETETSNNLSEEDAKAFESEALSIVEQLKG